MAAPARRRPAPLRLGGTGEAALALRDRSARYRAGKELRQELRRSKQGVWRPDRARPDPVSVLRAADAGKVDRLLGIKYARMASSPFAFFRGSSAIMARDLAALPITRIPVQMVGDAHLANFGFFATPERDQVFDVNDFDETFAGPWEWDVKRLGTSLVLAARELGYPASAATEAVRRAARTYRARMHTFARMPYLDVWYSHLDLSALPSTVGRAGRHFFRSERAKAAGRTGFDAFPTLARQGSGGARIRRAPPLVNRLADPHEEEGVREVLRRYRASLAPERRALLDRYHLEDVAEKVVGVGSVGTRCAVALYLGDDDVLDPVFLQVKEARASVAEPYLGSHPFRNQGERVVVGQRMVQEASDVLLGWASDGTRDFYVRQLRDMKFSSDLTSLSERALLGQAELCGAALARAHARTGDPARLAGYLGRGDGLDRALERFARAYAGQVESDHEEFVRAIRAGRLPSIDLAPGTRSARRARKV